MDTEIKKKQSTEIKAQSSAATLLDLKVDSSDQPEDHNKFLKTKNSDLSIPASMLESVAPEDKISIPNRLNQTHVSANLKRLIEHCIHPNVRIRIGSWTFECHLTVLQCYSAYFQRLGVQTEIKLPKKRVLPSAFQAMYAWMVADEPVIKRDGVVKLLVAACFLEVEPLVHQIWLSLNDAKCLSEDMAYCLYIEACAFELKSVRQIMLARISKFFLVIVAFQEFLLMPAKDVCFLLSSNMIGVNTEIEIFMSCLRWLNYDWIKRKRHLPKLMQRVRFTLMPPAFLMELDRNLIDNAVIKCVMKERKIREIISDNLRHATNRVCFGSDDQSYNSNGYNVEAPRRWLYDKTCSYHIEKSLESIYKITYEKFLQYLVFLQSCEKDHWKTFCDIKNENSLPAIRTGKQKLQLRVCKLTLRNKHDILESKPSQQSYSHTDMLCINDPLIEKVDSGIADTANFYSSEGNVGDELKISSNCAQSTVNDNCETDYYSSLENNGKWTCSNDLNNELDVKTTDQEQCTTYNETTSIEMTTSVAESFDFLEQSVRLGKMQLIRLEEGNKVMEAQLSKAYKPDESINFVSTQPSMTNDTEKNKQEEEREICILKTEVKVMQDENHLSTLACDETIEQQLKPTERENQSENVAKEGKVKNANTSKPTNDSGAIKKTKVKNCSCTKKSLLQGSTLILLGGTDPYKQQRDKTVGPQQSVIDKMLFFRDSQRHWTESSQTSFSRRHHHGAAVCNGIVYIVGGANVMLCCKKKILEASVWAFDPKTKKWSFETNLPQQRKDFAVISIDSKNCDAGFFVIGGENANGVPLDTVWFYNLVHKYWQRKASLNIGRSGFAAAIVNDEIWIGGGIAHSPKLLANECSNNMTYRSNFITDTMECFSLEKQYDNGDPNSSPGDAWIQLEFRLRQPCLYGRFCTTKKNELYLVGGIGRNANNLLNSLNAVDRFDFNTKQWLQCGKMKFARHGHDVVMLDDCIVAIGGVSWQEKHALQSVEIVATKKHVQLYNDIPDLPCALSGFAAVIV